MSQLRQGFKEAMIALFLGWLLWLTSGAIILLWAMWGDPVVPH